MTTTYLGCAHGAQEAKTEVASLPATWAVPVFPATHTLLMGKPLKAGAAVPCETASASAFLMYASSALDTGRCPTMGGVVLRTRLPSARTRPPPIPALTTLPPLPPPPAPRP